MRERRIVRKQCAEYHHTLNVGTDVKALELDRASVTEGIDFIHVDAYAYKALKEVVHHDFGISRKIEQCREVLVQLDSLDLFMGDRNPQACVPT